MMMVAAEGSCGCVTALEKAERNAANLNLVDSCTCECRVPHTETGSLVIYRRNPGRHALAAQYMTAGAEMCLKVFCCPHPGMSTD